MIDNWWSNQYWLPVGTKDTKDWVYAAADTKNGYFGLSLNSLKMSTSQMNDATSGSISVCYLKETIGSETKPFLNKTFNGKPTVYSYYDLNHFDAGFIDKAMVYSKPDPEDSDKDGYDWYSIDSSAAFAENMNEYKQQVVIFNHECAR